MPKPRVAKKVAKKRLGKKVIKTPTKSPLKGIIKKAAQSRQSLPPGDGPLVEKEVQFMTEVQTEVEMHLSDLELDFEDDSDYEDFGYFGERQTEEHEIEVEESEKNEDYLITIEEEFVIEESETKGSEGSDESVEKDKFAAADKIGTVKLPKSKDFFKIFGTVPDINDIPLDPWDLLEPGTIQILEPQAPQTEEEEEQEMVSEEMSAGSVELSTEFSELDYEIYVSEDDQEEVSAVERGGKKVDTRDLFDMLAALHGPPVVEIDEDAILELARLNEIKLLQDDTASFLEQLIECAVQAAEYVDVEAELREKLDKMKLVKALIGALETMKIEKKANDFLQRRSVEFHKRRKNFGLILPDPEGYLQMRENAFNRVLTELNLLLGQESTVQERVYEEIHVAQQEMEAMQEIFKSEIDELEAFIRATFENRKERFKTIVQAEISRMAGMRHEISECRFKCLQRSNKLNFIKAEMDVLDDLGDNLKLTGFQNLSHEVYLIKRKYEDRKEELFRIRNRFLRWAEALGHMREKRTMLYYTVVSQKEALQNAVEKRQKLMRYVHKMRLRHMRMQKENWYISASSGLVDKPALCRDYDLTMERKTELGEKVNALKVKIADIERRIHRCEEKMKLGGKKSYKERKN